MVHAENHDMIKWLADRLLGARARRSRATTRSATPASPRARRPTARSALARAARRADPHRPCLGRRGDRRDPQRADQGPQDLRRDLPAISVPHRRRHRHGSRGHQILLLAAAARRGGAGGGVARPRKRHLPGVLVRPRALSLRRDRQAAEGRQDHLQGHRQRRPGHRTARAAAVFRGGAARAASTSTALSR